MTEKSKIGTFLFKSESYLADFRGQMTLPMLGNYLLEVASRHAAERGFGYNEMTERNTAWVLSRLAIEIEEYPRMDDEFYIKTWVEEVNKLFTTRCFEILSKEEKILGYARSVWAAIDIETRKPTILDRERLKEYISDKECPIDNPGKILAIEEESGFTSYIVKYSDLDINGHLNSIKYIEHLLDLFDISMFEKSQINRFEIAYMAEGRFGMELNLYNKEIKENQYNMAITNNNKAICRASVRWTK